MFRCLVGAVVMAVGAGAMTGVPAEAAARPDTKITSGPSGAVASRTVVFKFRSARPGSTFQCRMDGLPWKACSSPKKYTRLKQGKHTFRVRARKNGRVDRTPAVRRFSVDTVGPQTMLLTGPEGLSGDHTPTFTFEASEPATFKCRFDTDVFEPCTSPFAPAEMSDEVYRFQVRAVDALGNADKTPATQLFEILTPITLTEEFAEAAAAYYFPDSATLDVPASCGSSTPVDCPGGVAVPASDQLHLASARSLTAQPEASRYDVTTTSTVQTLDPIVVTLPIAGDCNLTVDSAPGALPAWSGQMPMDFVTDATTGEMRIVPGNLALTGVETADLAISGPFSCSLVDFGLSFYVGLLSDQLSGLLASHTLCAARGPELVAACPPPG